MRPTVLSEFIINSTKKVFDRRRKRATFPVFSRSWELLGWVVPMHVKVTDLSV